MIGAENYTDCKRSLVYEVATFVNLKSQKSVGILLIAYP